MITFDAASNSGYQAASSSYSWSHTCTGSNRILIVSVSTLSALATVNTITYNGVSLTRVRLDSDSVAIGTEIWRLVAPATGSNTIAVTLSGACVSGSSASSYTGVNQTTPIDANNGNTGTTGAGGGSSTLTVTSATNNTWAVDAIVTADTTITVHSGQTQRNNITGAAGSGAQSDKGPVASPSDVIMQWDNIGGLLNWVASGVTLASDGVSPSASVSPSSSASRSLSPSSSVSQSLSPSSSTSPSSSVSASVSPSASASPSASSSASPSPQFTPTNVNITAMQQTDSIKIVQAGDTELVIID